MGVGQFRILLVEDEPVISELVRTMLESDGVEVKCVGDGPSAITSVKQAPPDLVLLDVVLPRLDGLAVCRMLRADPSHAKVPIYMLTAKVRPTDRESARRAGASGYIEKPFKMQELRALIANLKSEREAARLP